MITNQKEHGAYDDILFMQHPVSEKHARMSVADRAAQFSPFAALTGYEAVVKEAGRLTEQKHELDEEQKRKLDLKVQFLQSRMPNDEIITIRYFEPDTRKKGGAYIEIFDKIKKIDRYQRVLVMGNQLEIPLDDIVDLSSEALYAQFGE
ncbi:MAG: hypothetical protein Q4D51_01895 [Eubacteriales bacterium]|nr:hypothetical protein [Eubacteriales bacterium]